MKEDWKQINNYNNYFINSDGIIKSIDRIVLHKKSGKKFCKGQIIKPQKDTRGYNFVPLTNNLGEKKNPLVHRILMLTFNPIENSENLEVNHIDGIKTNNILSNLEWNTPSQNVKHSYEKLGRTAYYKGKTGINHNCSVKIDQFDLNGNFIKYYNSISDAARDLSCTTQSITAVLRGYRPTAKGFFWKYRKLKN